uniref:IncF plasmid conjugative transfer pilus assembly protein TraH n=1 Tax=Klebsiella pneumoniae TaxID=573 RepID=A0A8B0SU57_KLEPN|nr:IncF plasmid conjugative transfer pilus assembly protein TraH [Klebsiella pneumoniae]
MTLPSEAMASFKDQLEKNKPNLQKPDPQRFRGSVHTEH